jgi:hypothetical protein
MSDPETIEEFQTRWAAEFAEWSAIRDVMAYEHERGMREAPSAHDVTQEQRRRMIDRGEVSVLDGVFARRFINRGLSSPHERKTP